MVDRGPNQRCGREGEPGAARRCPPGRAAPAAVRALPSEREGTLADGTTACMMEIG